MKRIVFYVLFSISLLSCSKEEKITVPATIKDFPAWVQDLPVGDLELSFCMNRYVDKTNHTWEYYLDNHIAPEFVSPFDFQMGTDKTRYVVYKREKDGEVFTDAHLWKLDPHEVYKEDNIFGTYSAVGVRVYEHGTYRTKNIVKFRLLPENETYNDGIENTPFVLLILGNGKWEWVKEYNTAW